MCFCLGKHPKQTSWNDLKAIKADQQYWACLIYKETTEQLIAAVEMSGDVPDSFAGNGARWVNLAWFN